jgi:hypothetical protein
MIVEEEREFQPYTNVIGADAASSRYARRGLLFCLGGRIGGASDEFEPKQVVMVNIVSNVSHILFVASLNQHQRHLDA